MRFLRGLAAFLVLSPLVPGQLQGQEFEVGAGPSPSISFLDVAYEAAHDVYLAVWTEAGQVTAQRVRADGTPVGAPLAVGQGVIPRVCTVSLRGAWVVVWSFGPTLRARAVFAVDGSLSNTVTLTTGLVLPSSYDVAGESDRASGADDAVVVWHEASRLRGVQVDVGPGPAGTIFAAGYTTLRTLVGELWDDLSIAHAGGVSRRLLLGWREVSNGLTWITGMVVDMNLGVLDSLVNLVPVTGDVLHMEDIGGDGTRWVITYARHDGDLDVHCRSVEYVPANPTATGVGFEVAHSAFPILNESSARVDWFGGSAIVAHVLSGFSPSGPIPVAGPIDPFTCADCNFPTHLIGAGPTRHVAVASERSGGGSGDGGLLVWQERENGTDTVLAQALLARDGHMVDLGGGCGAGGATFASCARTGHGEFRLRVRGATPSSSAWLLIGFGRIDLACGSCVVVPDPTTGGLLGPFPTNGRGQAEMSLPLPSSPALIGLSFHAQWMVAGTPASCPAMGVDLSNALQVVIE